METDLDEVLQIPSVFLNVSKGQVAPRADLLKSFKTDDTNVIIQEVLKRGDLQVGEKERAHQLESVHRDIASIVAEKCINPETKRPYTTSMIEKALAELHLSIRANKSPKQQALEAIKLLQERRIIPIARAQMRIRLTMASKDGKRIKEKVLGMIATVEEDDWSAEWELVGLIDPGQLRSLSDLLQSETKGRGKLETLSLSEMAEGDEHLG